MPGCRVRNERKEAVQPSPARASASHQHSLENSRGGNDAAERRFSTTSATCDRQVLASASQAEHQLACSMRGRYAWCPRRPGGPRALAARPAGGSVSKGWRPVERTEPNRLTTRSTTVVVVQGCPSEPQHQKCIPGVFNGHLVVPRRLVPGDRVDRVRGDKGRIGRPAATRDPVAEQLRR